MKLIFDIAFMAFLLVLDIAVWTIVVKNAVLPMTLGTPLQYLFAYAMWALSFINVCFMLHVGYPLDIVGYNGIPVVWYVGIIGLFPPFNKIVLSSALCFFSAWVLLAMIYFGAA